MTYRGPKRQTELDLYDLDRNALTFYRHLAKEER
jgi:hypothetical protein